METDSNKQKERIYYLLILIIYIQYNNSNNDINISKNNSNINENEYPDNSNIKNSEQLKISHSQSQMYSINNVDLSNNSHQLINSPRTIKACQNLGIEQEELYQLTLDEFLSKNPELNNISSDLLKYHYEGKERIRKDLVKMVKEERKRIIKEEEAIKKLKKSKTLEECEPDQIMQNLNKKEKKIVELIQKRQRMRIETALESQINKELMMKTNMAKDIKYKVKEQEYMKELEKRKIENEQKEKILEKKRQDETNRRNEEQEMKQKEIEEKEQKRRNDIIDEEKRNEMLLKQKAELESRILLEKKKTMELNNKLKEAQIRKKLLEHQRYEELFNQQKEKAYEDNKRRVDEKNLTIKQRQEEHQIRMHKSMEDLKERIETKEKNTQFFLSKMNNISNQIVSAIKEKNKKREEKVLQNLMLEKDRQEKNRKLFYDKQLYIEQNVFLRSFEKEEKKKKQQDKLLSLYSLTQENKKQIEKEALKKNNLTLRKLELFDERVKDIQKKAESILLRKREEDRIKQYQNTINIERQNRITQAMNMKKLAKMKERDEKLEQIRNKRELFYKQKAKMEQEVQMKADEILNKVDEMMTRKSEIDPEFIKKTFPDDEELYNRVVKLAEKQKKGEEKIHQKYGFYEALYKRNNPINLRKKSKSTNFKFNNIGDNYYSFENQYQLNKSDEKIKSSDSMGETEEERIIINKVEEYKSNLQKEFEKLILEEKKKEDERVKKYEEEKDSSKKQELEKKNSVERAQGTKTINEAKESMDKKVKEYEQKLRKK